MKPRTQQFAINRQSNEKVAKNILHYLCDELEIQYTPTNSIHYLLDAVQSKEYPQEIYSSSIDYIKPVRACITNLISKCIKLASERYK